MSTVDIELKDGDGVIQEYYGVESITLNGVDGTDKTFIYDDGTTMSELPEVTIDDNGMVLGVVEGKWDKMELSNNGGSGQIGTIEIPTTISWSADPTPTITTDFNIGGTAYRMYKIADVTPTKAQLLSAHWSVSSPDGTTMFNKMLTSDEIGIDTTDMLQFRFTNDPTYAYAVCYTTGEITVDFAGIPITVDILETGLYQVMEAKYGLPNTLYGSCSYLVTEQVDFVQSNWEQNDAMQPDYVKNRPFYRGELKTEKWIVGIPLSFTLENLHEPYSYVGIPPEELLKLWYSDWEQLIVTWDGVEYFCQPKYVLGGTKFIGNAGPILGSGFTNEPFSMTCLRSDDIGGTEDIFMIYSTEDTVQAVINATFNFTAVEDKTIYYFFTPVENLSLIPETEYRVMFNGFTYSNGNIAIQYTSEDITYIGLGNPFILGLGEDNGVPYFIYTSIHADGTQNSGIVTTSGAGPYDIIVAAVDDNPPITHEISISSQTRDIKQLDIQYLSNIPWNKIENKPFDTIPAGTILAEGIADCNIQFNGDLYATVINEIPLNAGATYSVSWDGMTYDITATDDDSGDIIVLWPPDDTHAMFLIATGYIPDSTMLVGTSGSHTYSIKSNEETIKKIDSKYLPEITGALPEYATDNSDNGKVLQIEDSTVVWKILDNQLPIVDTTQNSQVLKVVNGAWAVAEEIQELPTITSSNNEQVLTAINGNWYAMEVPKELPKIHYPNDEGKILTVSNGGWQAVMPIKELPIVTTNNNNQVLKVIDGVWATAEEIQELPTITTDDDGKFLRIVNGSPAWQTVQNASEVQF